MKKRWSVWDDMKEMQSQMDNIFSRFFGMEPFKGNTGLLLPGPERSMVEKNFREPLSDVIDKGNEIIARIEMPGINKEDINISVTDDGVEIKAEKKDEYKEEDKKKGKLRLERSYSGFYRYFNLPQDADKDKIEAVCKNGILELRIPKKHTEKKKAKKIPVK